MNGERPLVNGQHLLNGATSTQHHQATEAKISRIQQPGPPAKVNSYLHDEPYENGILVNGPASTETSNMPNTLEHAPLEVLQLVGKEHYLPLSTMISRTAQNCWNDLCSLVDQLSSIPVSQQSQDPSRPSYGIANNQSKSNLDKKDRILNFADNQKSVFIKLLVLLQWGKSSDDVSKTVNLNYWLQNRRSLFTRARDDLAILKGDAPNFQIPNPDLETASKILSLRKATGFPDIGYQQRTPIKTKQILATIRKLSRTVAVRLALEQHLPPQLRRYYVHDGRATFTVPNKFEIDLSVLEESANAQFRVVDFRLTFSPSPTISENRRQEIEFIANSVIDQDGLLGCFDFFHNLALTSQISEYYNQAIQLSRNQWAGHLGIEFLRRDLVVEYWRNSHQKKSWIEISIHSGHDTREGPVDPYLQVRWFREGKMVDDFELEMDLARLSFESLLLQVLSQHANNTLDSVYDRLATAEIFKDDDMAVEQSISAFDPWECKIDVQLAKNTHLSISIDPTTGSVVVGPASDQASRLQVELSAAKTKGEDLVPRLLNYRCVLSEGRILRSLKDTTWERLDALTSNTAEIRALFGSPLARVNFYRHPLWTNQYMMAFSNSFNGDKIWILEKAKESRTLALRDFRVLHEQKLEVDEKLSTSYFETFAEYASGVVILHSNAATLRALSSPGQLPTIPKFEENYQLPALTFESGLGKSSSSGTAANSARIDGQQCPDSAVANDIKLRFKELDLSSKRASLSAELHCRIEPSVLERLSISNSDGSLTFAPDSRTIWIELNTTVGTAVIGEVTDRVICLNDIIACIRMVQNLSSMSLISVSMRSLTICYKHGQDQESRLAVDLPSPNEPARLRFAHTEKDPHDCLIPQLSELLADTRQSFSINLRDALLAIYLTHTLVLTLNDLEHHGSGSEGNGNKANVRLHVLVRTPTMFALQFFSKSGHFGEHPTTAQHERLLARFEILPSVRRYGQWLIRPAIEEINAYSRPSFAAQSLQDRIREVVFKKQGDCPDWIRLDSAAVFLKDKPQPLLTTLYTLISDWSKENPSPVAAIPAAAPAEVKTTPQQPQPPPPKGGNSNVNGNSNARKASGPQKAQVNAANQQKGKNTPNRAQQPAKKQEVITIE